MGSLEPDIVQKAEAILAAAKAYKGDPSERYGLMEQLDVLYKQLENPMDAMIRQWNSMVTETALTTMVKMGGFEKMSKDGSITAKELAAQTKLEPDIVVRLMRMLISSGTIAQVDEETYSHTPKSLAFLEGGARDFWNLCMNMKYCFTRFPDYFNEKTAEDIVDLRKTPYCFAYGMEGKTFYEALTSSQENFNMFNKAMMQMEINLPTLGMFPFSSLDEQVKAEPERAFIVDIGGGRGQSLLLIQKEIANTFGTTPRMILQDRPVVLDSVPQELLPGIEKMPYDFYTEQPVKNAHIYYYRRIMHNYYDGVCQAILKQAAAAMGPTSRLLIGDLVIPTVPKVGEDMTPYWMDMVMIAIGGKERSEKEFRELLDSVGLELVKVWPYHSGSQAVLEARKKSV
ncbi:O-methyltransferase [Tricladium varicosporioides]|nr:O-methyltransferase [Hymenoscyphus varicosporioides]